MNNYPCSYETWVRYVRAQHASNLVPTEWVAPRRLDEQRRGLKFAMTFGELQRMLDANPTGTAFDVSRFQRSPRPSLPGPADETPSLFPSGFEPEHGGQHA